MSRFRLAVVGLLTASFVSYAPAAQAAGSVNVGNFSQCANGPSPSTSLACTGWINGAINQTKAHFGEDDVVPQRLQLTLPSDTSSHTLTIQYQTRKSGIHAYDSLATWNKTSSAADACQGIAASTCAGSPSTFPMASDSTSVNPVAGGASPVTSTHELPQADRQWTLYGGTIETPSRSCRPVANTISHSAGRTSAESNRSVWRRNLAISRQVMA